MISYVPMISNAPSPYRAMRREIAERLSSFFVEATDGRGTSNDIGAAVATSQGPYRERNEDRCAVARISFGSSYPDIRLAIICDGMGGMQKGAEAASLAMGAFLASCATTKQYGSLIDRLDAACRFANDAVFNAFRGEAGTTLTAVATSDMAECAVHVGDSRLYGLKLSREIELLTRDDTVSSAVNRHLGQIDEDELDNRLLQFIGIGPGIEPNFVQIDTKVHYSHLLLTTDGIHSVGRKVLSSVCDGSNSPLELVRKLVFIAEAINTHDNASAVCMISHHPPPTGLDHQGLTIQVTTPQRNIEVWIPSSATKDPLLAERQKHPSTVTDPEQRGDQSHLPKAARSRKGAGNRGKIAARKRRTPQNIKELPLDVVFEVEGKDD